MPHPSKVDDVIVSCELDRMDSRVSCLQAADTSPARVLTFIPREGYNTIGR